MRHNPGILWRLLVSLLLISLCLCAALPGLTEEAEEELELNLEKEGDSWGDEWFSGLDLTFRDDEEDLSPMSEEELLRVLAEADDTGFTVMPEGVAEEDFFTILLIGSDAYESDEAAGERGRADTTIFVQVDAANKKIRMVSFLRDLYLPIPGKNQNRLNAAYMWGGERLLRRTLKNNFGITADAYMEVNFSRLIRLIDAIGGIDLEVSEEEQRQVNSILRFYNTHTGDPEEDQLLEASGTVHLTGKQALCYARIRKIDNDFERTKRQRKVVEAAFHRVMEMDLAAIARIVGENLDAVNTDLTLQDCLRLIPLAVRCTNASFSTMTVPAPGTWKNEMVGSMSVLDANLPANRRKLATFLSE
ncbi:MAG: LCP family protein [Clostridia bacterium]|nr:LCP family protein [Clostridia bacterium]